MRLTIILLVVVIVCTTIIYVFRTGVNFSACHVDAGGFNTESVELVIPASKQVKYTSMGVLFKKRRRNVRFRDCLRTCAECPESTEALMGAKNKAVQHWLDSPLVLRPAWSEKAIFRSKVAHNNISYFGK